MNLTPLLKLLRISAWPTLLSNVLAAWWLAESAAGKNAALGLLPMLLLTASCFYLAGMVLNDFFDARLDAQERPERPIPSGEVSRLEAGLLGFFLHFCGLIGVEVCAAATGSTLLRYVGWLLAAFIVSYDAVFKRIPVVGPAVMGYCRFLNILFVVVAVNAVVRLSDVANETMPGSDIMIGRIPAPWEGELALLSWPVCYAFGILSYIFGVTLISSFEAGLPADKPLDWKRRISIAIAVGFSLIGLLLVFAPILGAKATGNFSLFLNFNPLAEVTIAEELDFSGSPWSVFPTFLFAALPFALLWKPTLKILCRPTPESVRRFVGTALALLIPIDAIACLVYVGVVPALAVLCLYPLAIWLRRIVPMS